MHAFSVFSLLRLTKLIHSVKNLKIITNDDIPAFTEFFDCLVNDYKQISKAKIMLESIKIDKLNCEDAFSSIKHEDLLSLSGANSEQDLKHYEDFIHSVVSK